MYIYQQRCKTICKTILINKANYSAYIFSHKIFLLFNAINSHYIKNTVILPSIKSKIINIISRHKSSGNLFLLRQFSGGSYPGELGHLEIEIAPHQKTDAAQCFRISHDKRELLVLEFFDLNICKF